MFDETLTATGSTYSPGNNEGIAFDAADNLWQNGDGAQTSIRLFTPVGTRASGAAYASGTDREIVGANTNLMAPKGIDIANGYVFVADFGAGDIKVFTTADGRRRRRRADGYRRYRRRLRLGRRLRPWRRPAVRRAHRRHDRRLRRVRGRR